MSDLDPSRAAAVVHVVPEGGRGKRSFDGDELGTGAGAGTRGGL